MQNKEIIQYFFGVLRLAPAIGIGAYARLRVRVCFITLKTFHIGLTFTPSFLLSCHGQGYKLNEEYLCR